MKNPLSFRILTLLACLAFLPLPASADSALSDLVSILRLRESKQNAEIVSACEGFLKSHPKSAADATVRFYLAKALHDTKEYQESIEAVGKLLQLHPGTDLLEASVMLRGEGFRLLKKYDESIPDFRRARELAHVKQGANAAHAHYHIIQAHHYRRRADEAKAELDRLKEDYPKSSYVRSATSLLDSKKPTARPETGPKVGTEAPDIEFFTMTEGVGEKLSKYAGKVVALEFWASWCGPCQAPMTKMQTYREKNPHWGDKVELIAVSIDSTKDKAVSHLKQKGWKSTYNVWAGEGGFQSKPAATYGVRGIPSMFIIDQNGKVARKGHPMTLGTPDIINGLLKGK